MSTPNTLAYHLLGRTGLRVSPLALGTMTFGSQSVGGHDWGMDEDTARAVFLRYLDAGGNFVDTANNYTRGESERLLGRFIRETDSRERLVLATKFTAGTDEGNPNASGNGRKNMLAALDASLRRLRTDYVDLYWLHVWDTMTPVEEVMSTFDALVRSGKVRAVGLSDVPAWYAAKAQLLAREHGWEPVAALQLEYSLVERNIEREHIPAALDLGMGVVPWSPLANGFLTGKYGRDGDTPVGEGRLQAFRGMDFLRTHTDRHWQTLDTVRTMAEQLGRTPAQVALNWTARQPGIVSTIVGARTVAQLDDNLAALDFDLEPDQVAALEEADRPAVLHPYGLFDQQLWRRFTAGADVRRAPTWYRRG